MYSLADSLYHRLLRIGALTLVLLLIFVSGIFHDTTAELANLATNQMANAIGISVGVAPTELNMMSAEFASWERTLAAREAVLLEREIAVGLNASESSVDWSTFILATILFILLLLIVLNYALDYMRRQPRLDSVSV